MKIVLDIDEKYAKDIDKQKIIEICFRNSKKRFKEFIKVNFMNNEEIKNSLEDAANMVFRNEHKAEKSTNLMINKISVLDKNIDKFGCCIEELSEKADLILKRNSKMLNWADLMISSLDLCATVAGFAIISEKMDQMTKELGDISKSVKDIVNHQELLDQQEVKALINEYANIQNKESLNENVSVDDYYNLVNKLSLAIETLRECFVKDIGHRKIYLNALSILLPIYALSMCKFDKAHYFKYMKTHTNRETYIKVLDDFVDKDFFAGIQEHCFFDETQELNSRDSQEIAFAYLEKINEERLVIADQLKIISNFDSEEQYNNYQKNFSHEIVGKITESMKNKLPEELIVELQTTLERG